MNATSTSVAGCGPATLATQTDHGDDVVPDPRLRRWPWSRDSTSLNTGVLTATLLEAGTAVAISPQAFATDYNTGTSRSGMSVTAVLFAGTSSFPASATAYVADPGTYTLRLDGSASDGGCAGTATFRRTWLTYALLGTSP